MVEHFTQVLDCVDASFIHNDLLRQWSLPGTFHGYPVAGIDVNAPRMRAVTQAFVALSTRKDGFRTIDLANIVNDIFVSQSICYSSRQAAYDLKKFRAKGLVEKKPNSLRYMLTENGIRSIVAFQILREKVIEPLLENALSDEIPPKENRNQKAIWKSNMSRFNNICQTSLRLWELPHELIINCQRNGLKRLMMKEREY